MNLEYLKSKVILVLKLILFTKTTVADKLKLRFETLFSCLNVPSEIIFLVIHYRVYISNTLLPSNCFHSVFRIANEGDQLSKLSLSNMQITLNHVWASEILLWRVHIYPIKYIWMKNVFTFHDNSFYK